MGLIGLWLAIIFQLQYPIQTLAAAASAAAAVRCCWRGVEELCSEEELRRSGVSQEREPHRKGMCTQNINRAVTWRAPHWFCFAGCPFLDAWALASLA
eukprot:1158449-Pelagomonas_calceolata.AAC.11